MPFRPLDKPDLTWQTHYVGIAPLAEEGNEPELASPV